MQSNVCSQESIFLANDDYVSTDGDDDHAYKRGMMVLEEWASLLSAFLTT